EAALASIGGAIRGGCVRTSSRPAQVCATDADCDSAPGRGDGACRGRAIVFVPALTAHDTCTPFADVVVPLRRTGAGLRTGDKWIRLRTSPSDDPATGRRRTGDTDILRLYCDPS